MCGIRAPGLTLAFIAMFTAISLVACTKKSNGSGTTTTTPSSEQTQPRESRPSRSEVACHLHSCAPPRYCNRDKGVCELLPCLESRDCPYGYTCDFSRNVCQ